MTNSKPCFSCGTEDRTKFNNDFKFCDECYFKVKAERKSKK